MNTEETKIGNVETETEARKLLQGFFNDYGKTLPRQNAVEYRERLLKARSNRDFKVIREVWNGMGKQRFAKKDYYELIKPIINEDRQMVDAILDKSRKAKGLRSLAAISKLSRPVVPPVHKFWREQRDAIGVKLVIAQSQFHTDNGVITNKVGR